MRPPITVLPAVLSAAAAIALLAACGGSGGESGTAVGPTTGTSGGSAPATPSGTPGGSGSVDTATWCDQAMALSTDLQHTLGTAAADPTQVAPVLQQAATKYAGTAAPAPIEQDWRQVVGAVQTLATAAQDIDFTAPDAGDRLAASISGQQDELNAATTHVESFARQNCPAPSSAPTG
jgi:hypothetical protein